MKKEHKEINFLYAGRIIKQKGVYNILVSFRKLSLKYKNISDKSRFKNAFVKINIKNMSELSTEEAIKLKEQIGYLASEVYLYEELTVKEMLDYHESFYKKNIHKRRVELVKKLKLIACLHNSNEIILLIIVKFFLKQKKKIMVILCKIILIVVMILQV